MWKGTNRFILITFIRQTLIPKLAAIYKKNEEFADKMYGNGEKKVLILGAAETVCVCINNSLQLIHFIRFHNDSHFHAN